MKTLYRKNDTTSVVNVVYTILPPEHPCLFCHKTIISHSRDKIHSNYVFSNFIGSTKIPVGAKWSNVPLSPCTREMMFCEVATDPKISSLVNSNIMF